jgi:ribosomal protein S7
MHPIESFQNMKQFFIKKGKKNIIESRFYDYIKQRSVLNKTNTGELLDKTFNNTTNYVFLKSRRRGKRVKHKVTYLEAARGSKRAILTFSKLFKDQHKKGSSFARLLDKELNNISNEKNNLAIKRDELHKLALENTPQA